MKEILPQAGTMRTKQQWLLVAAYCFFAVLGLSSVLFFDRIDGLKAHAGLCCAISGGMFFLLYGLSGIWEGKTLNGFTFFSAAVRRITYKENVDPGWFAFGIISNFIISACFWAYVILKIKTMLMH